MADPKVTAALDRTITSPGQAMHLLSAVLMSAQKDGENLDLNEMFLSESTIWRGRDKAREEISKQQYEDFQDKKPDYLAVHWYLAPSVVLFSLFSDKVSDDTKSRMAAKLLSIE